MMEAHLTNKFLDALGGKKSHVTFSSTNHMIRKINMAESERYFWMEGEIPTQLYLYNTF